VDLQDSERNFEGAGDVLLVHVMLGGEDCVGDLREPEPRADVLAEREERLRTTSGRRIGDPKDSQGVEVSPRVG